MSEDAAADSLPERRLAALGLVLPAPVRLPSPNRTGAVLHGATLYVSGHGAALLDPAPGLLQRGKVGVDVTQEEGYAVARALALKMLATIRAVLGRLDRVERVVKIVGMVNAEPLFEHHNLVINGASDLFYEVFGEAGVHARSTFGVSGLVGNQPVEIEGVFAVRDAR